MFKAIFPRKSPSCRALALLAVTFWLALTKGAAAQFSAVYGTVQANDLGGVFYNLCANSSPFANLMMWISYAGGCFFAIAGVHHLRQHADEPRRHGLAMPLAMFMGATGLLALPSFIGMLASSLWLPTSMGTFVCAASGGAGIPGVGISNGGGSGVGLDMMMYNFMTNVKYPLLSFISMTAWLSGLYMIVRGLFKATKHGVDPKANAPHKLMIDFIFGALLMAIGGNVYMLSYSVFGAGVPVGSPSVISWTTVTSISPQFRTAVVAALSFVQIIGSIAFVRGWLLLKKFAEGTGNVSLAQGLTHIIGGVLAINIFMFLHIMDNTFGLQILN